MGLVHPQVGSTSVRYAILGRLATGGMAELFLASASSLGGTERHVVLKRVLPERLVDPQFATMFLDEARLAAHLHHQNIAQVHDIGRLGESYFFTMEYVHGEDVRAMLARLATLQRRLPISHVLTIAAGVAAGLHYAHDRTRNDGSPLNIVHRDVSPANVMVSFEGAIKLVDFGVAKATHRTVVTAAGAIKGKVAYLSPEQCRGREVDRRSDVFSMGILIHEMLTGSRLFRRINDYETMKAIVGEDIPPPSRSRPEVTPGLDRIVMTALAKDPRGRYKTAGEMLEAIEAIAIRDGWTMSAAGVGRFQRELFGERPEPWHDLGSRADLPNVVTVTGAAVELPSGAETKESVALDDPEVEARLKKTVELRPAPRPDSPVEDPGEHAATIEEDVADLDDAGRPTVKTPKLATATASAAAVASAAARRTSSTLPRPTSEPRPARPSEPKLAPVVIARPASEPAQAMPVARDTPAAAAAEASLFDSATSLPVAPATTTLQGMPAVATPPRKRTGYTAPPLTAGPSLRAFDDAAAASASGADEIPAAARNTGTEQAAANEEAEANEQEWDDAAAEAAATTARPRATSPATAPSTEASTAMADSMMVAIDDDDVAALVDASRPRRGRLYAIVGLGAVAAFAVVLALSAALRRDPAAPTAAAVAPTPVPAVAPTPAPVSDATAAVIAPVVEPAATDRVPEPVGEIAAGPTTPEPTVATPAAAPDPDPDPPEPPPEVTPDPADPTPEPAPTHPARAPRVRPASTTPPVKARTPTPTATKRPAKPTAEVATLDQIRAAVSARDWSRALQKCGNAPRKVLTGQVRGACALAACAAKRQTEARKYSAGLARSRITAIRQSCLSRGISID